MLSFTQPVAELEGERRQVEFTLPLRCRKVNTDEN